jgi:hypothetical protein
MFFTLNSSVVLNMNVLKINGENIKSLRGHSCEDKEHIRVKL